MTLDGRTLNNIFGIYGIRAILLKSIIYLLEIYVLCYNKGEDKRRNLNE